jgi:hypothetical protein
MQKKQQFASLEKWGPIGVAALKAATPRDHGDTAEGWYYEIIRRPGYYSIQWLNSHTVEPGHIPVAVLIQYGHGTRQGGRVQGVDYINPAMKPIFEQIANEMWKEVTR